METTSAVLGICADNPPVTGEFLTQRPVTRSFDVFFDLRLNKQLSKQSWGWWFETPPVPLWRHCNVLRISRYHLHYKCCTGWVIVSSDVDLQAIRLSKEYNKILSRHSSDFSCSMSMSPRGSCFIKRSTSILNKPATNRLRETPFSQTTRLLQ